MFIVFADHALLQLPGRLQSDMGAGAVQPLPYNVSKVSLLYLKDRRLSSVIAFLFNDH